MTTQTSRHHRSPDTDPPQHRRPPGGTIVVSVLVGAVAALALALVVFAGGAEATITGALLLGFGFGWALMATLTVRRTRQPQRWAFVLAVAMGATGAGLVAFTPGNQTLTAMNWVWPPILLTLAVWGWLQVRRSVPGKPRWLLSAVLAVLALAAVGATYDNLARTGDTEYAAPGTLYGVDGHRLHLDCRGHGSPTVVLSNGLGGVSAGWARVQDAVGASTRVCAYDRAGQGWSDEADSPLDGVESAADLHALLAAAGEKGPYVLVGHSTGGTYALTYAARYPDQVAGMVLLDSSSPEQLTRMPAYAGQYAIMRRVSALMPTMSRLGLGQIPAPSPLPAADAATVAAITSTPQFYRNQRDEWSVIPKVFGQAQALTSFGARPLAVLTASVNSVGNEGWAGAQEQLAALSSNSVHRTVDSSHMGLLGDVRPAAESVRAINEVIASVRTGTRLGPR